MKKTLITAALVALALPAGAGTITITVVTAVAPCNTGMCSKSYTDTDANIAKVVTAYGPDCQEALRAPCTAQQTLAFAFDQVMSHMVDTVTGMLRRQSIQALPPIVPISPK